MNTIRKLKNLYKARFGTFTDDEFDALCKEYSNLSGLFNKSKRLGAETVLRVFFANRTPNLSQLNAVYSYDDNLKWLYLQNISKKRKLTDKEQYYMASFMNFGPVFRFPQKLDDAAVLRMFEVGNVRRIATYVRDFPLSERFELELIDRYAKQKPYGKSDYGKCDYGVALSGYLESCRYPKCLSAKVQDRLLEVVDEDMWVKLCASQSMSVNALHKNTIRELIAKRYSEAIRSLLFYSYMPTVELQRYLYSSFPKLKWDLEISKVRHALRGLELRNKEFMGVEAPSYDEAKIVEAAILTDDVVKFMEVNVCPLLKSGAATPYLCAWAVNECPQLGEIAYTCLRGFAEKYRNKNV